MIILRIPSRADAAIHWFVTMVITAIIQENKCLFTFLANERASVVSSSAILTNFNAPFPIFLPANFNLEGHRTLVYVAWQSRNW
jgi:hypothetical protein